MKNKAIILVSILILVAIIICMFILGNKSYYNVEPLFGSDEEKLMGIIQIGGSELDYDYSVVDRYFQTCDFETIEFGGTEKYLIIPREDEIDVYYLELTEDGGMKEEFKKTMDAPFYITCNVSDIISNSLLRIKKGPKQYSYSPYISLKDGSLVVEDFVLHIK